MISSPPPAFFCWLFLLISFSTFFPPQKKVARFPIISHTDADAASSPDARIGGRKRREIFCRRFLKIHYDFFAPSPPPSCRAR